MIFPSRSWSRVQLRGGQITFEDGQLHALTAEVLQRLRDSTTPPVFGHIVTYDDQHEDAS